MDASNRPQCLPGTRTEILKEIIDWMFSDMDKNMVWLHGVAGSGKSTVSTTIAKYCFDMNRQGAHLFFVRGKSKPNRVIRDIAFRLASFDPFITENVAAAVEKNNGIAEAPLESQFEKLLLEPLRAAAEAMTGPVAVVLDALDECGSPDERSRLVKLLREEFPKLPTIFRFIVTSRPEADLTDAFSSSQSVFAVGLDYMSKASKEDVFRYLDVEIRAVMRGQQHQHVEVDWEETVETLGKTADGLFIWASTAVKMVKQSDEPSEELQDLVDFCRSRGSTPQAGVAFSLNQLYDAVLENSGIQWHKPRSRERFAQVLGLILFSKALITPRTIDGLLGLSSRNILSRLASVLAYSSENPDVPVHLFHTSFSDYLLARERKEQRWFIDVSEQRLFLAARCFDVMADKLCFNVCGLESSFVANDEVPGLETRIKERFPSHLQYACRYWAEHVCDVSHAQSSKLIDQLTIFVERHLLYWFEALSLMKRFDHVANRSLYDVSLWAGPNWPDISSIVWGAFRFASIFSYPMSRSAPHVYLSALSLGMEDFTFAERYAKRFLVIRSQRFGTKPAQPCLKVLRGHTSRVQSIAFSPSGRLIASGSTDGTVCVWDVDSGDLVSGPFSGHKDSVLSVAFSPDGRRVASGSYDKTIHMWDVDSGKLFSRPLKGHTGYIYSVVFSPDVERIASSSDDKTIRVWDVHSGELVAGPFQGHEGRVWSVTFSPDGRRIATGSEDKTIRVWDVDSGKVVSGPFEGHTAVVRSVAFSPDGRRIASGTEDKMIRVWDVDSGKLVSGPSEGFRGWIRSVAFSPDGACIASGSDDSAVHLWSVRSGELVAGPFEGHEGHTLSVAFSPDGRRIASGSEDRTIRIWDVDSGKLDACPFQGHEDRVNSVAFLRDGRHIVSGSNDKTIRIWDADSGKLDVGPLQGHEGHVWSVAVSPDGRYIASGSDDNTIRVWDVDSGKLASGPFEGREDWVRSVAFSPDGRRIVSGSDDKMIRIWDVDSGKLVAGPFQGHVEAVYSVAFSPDGHRIVSGSFDKTIRVWNADSGKLVAGPFEGHRASVRSVVYSQDGRRIASGSGDNTVRVWDVDSGKLASGPFEGHEDWVCSVAFSPDGRRIVSGSDDKTIRIWDVDLGKLVAGPFRGHAGGVRSVAFSPDGRRIASGSSDKTIRMWDVDSGKLFSHPLKGQTGYICSMALSSYGERSASGSSDGTIRIRDGGRPIDRSITSVEDVRSNVENGDKSEPERSRKSTSEQPGSRLIREQICGGPSWTISVDGWLLGKSGELIIWIPEDIRRSLWHPSTTAIMSCRFYTKLDFTGARLGDAWHEGYPRNSSE